MIVPVDKQMHFGRVYVDLSSENNAVLKQGLPCKLCEVVIELHDRHHF